MKILGRGGESLPVWAAKAAHTLFERSSDSDSFNVRVDMKKIVAIYGSPRRKGNTALLLDQAVQGAEDGRGGSGKNRPPGFEDLPLPGNLRLSRKRAAASFRMTFKKSTTSFSNAGD